MTKRPSCVRLYVPDTGEVKEWAMEGIDRRCDSYGHVHEDEWEAGTLDLALGLVPSLTEAVARARLRGESITVTLGFEREVEQDE